MKKWYISMDIGLTGYFTIIEYVKGEYFKVVCSEKIQVELKEDSMFKMNSKTKSAHAVKNQVSFTKNREVLKEIMESIGNSQNSEFMGLIEQVTPRPFNARVLVMSLGDTSGTCRSILESLGAKTLVIAPQTWKGQLKLTKEKQESLDLFQILLNNFTIPLHDSIQIDEKTLKTFKKMKNNNQIESVLIAYFHYKFA